MFIAVSHDPTIAADGAVTSLAGGLLDVAGALVHQLGPVGTVVALAVADVALLVKYPKARPAHVAAFRAAWRAVLAACHIRRPSRLRPTKEERRILRRLAPGHWRSHAEGRGLEGTITGRARLTEAGIVCQVRLDGKWTLKALRKHEDSVRALLGCRTDLKVEITTGKRGGWAQLTFRTRSAVDTADMRWAPGCKGIGLDTVTGRPVEIPVGRLLLAGSSGAGKSVTLRPYLAPLCADEKSAVVMIDLKRVEGALWRTRARVARTAEETAAVAAELQAEMMARLEELETTGRASWTPTARRPRLVVVVDEGAEVSSVAKDAMAALESVARMGRAAEIHLVWCTQKPTMSGASAGIPPQIASVMDVRLCLRVATATEVRTVLGEDATADNWDAHTLPKPGVLLIRGTGRGPDPVKVWHMDDATVRALPPAPVWHGPKGDGDGQAPTVQLSLVKQAEPASEEQVLAALADGFDRVPALVERTGLSRPTVYRALEKLQQLGKAVQAARGQYVTTGAEVAR